MEVQTDNNSLSMYKDEASTSADEQAHSFSSQDQPKNWDTENPAGLRNDVVSGTLTDQSSTTQSSEQNDNSDTITESDGRLGSQNPDNSRVPGGMYRTHKCLLIHDPWLRTFKHDKFSKWFDIERLEVNSLSDLAKSGMLLKTVSKLNPEVVFLGFFHLGQGDIWKKLEAETIAGYAKQMM